MSWIRHKPSATAVLNGVIAGLAGITPASGYIDPQYAAILGVILGFASYFSVFLFKHKLRIDDALGKFIFIINKKKLNEINFRCVKCSWYNRYCWFNFNWIVWSKIF